MIGYSTLTSVGKDVCCRNWLLTGCIFSCWVFFCCDLPIGVGGEENKDVQAGDAINPSIEQIHRWTRELDDDHYAVREAAQQQLVASGRLALDAVSALAASQDNSLESITRAARILTTWSESKDSSLRLAALERMAGLTHRPIEAALATEILATIYEQNAIVTLERLGALCEPANPIHANTPVPEQYKKRIPVRVTLGTHWQGTDDDLKHIALIRRPVVVSLHSAPIGKQALDHLTKIPTLRRVEIYGVSLPAESIDTLRAKLPKLEQTKQIVVRPSGAKLGIGGNLAQGGAHVITVVPDSAAHRGGLKQRDIITHVAGIPIVSFEALTQQIATYQPGDTVELTIKRKDQTVIKTVTFDRWGAEKGARNED
ncbi:MAG: PDZ domain-containing protein [Pirellulales bacterium]